jgi:hypothetical protein
MKRFKKLIQGWLGITNLAEKVVEIDLQLNGKQPDIYVEESTIIKGYDK